MATNNIIPDFSDIAEAGFPIVGSNEYEDAIYSTDRTGTGTGTDDSNPSGTATPKRRGRKPGSKNKAPSTQANTLRNSLPNDISATISDLNESMRGTIHESLLLKQHEINLLSRRTARMFSSTPEIPTKYEFAFNAVILGIVGACIAIPRWLVIKQSIRQQNQSNGYNQQQGYAMNQPSNEHTPQPVMRMAPDGAYIPVTRDDGAPADWDEMLLRDSEYVAV